MRKSLTQILLQESKNKNKQVAAKKNWKDNREAIIKGMRRFWQSAEGKAVRKKQSSSKGTKESYREEVEEMIVYFGEQEVELVSELQNILKGDVQEMSNVVEIARIMEEENCTYSEALVKKRKKKNRKKDPRRSRIMKIARRKNKAAFAKAAKKGARTRKSKGITKALGKFNSKNAKKESHFITAAAEFLEGRSIGSGTSRSSQEQARVELEKVSESLNRARRLVSDRNLSEAMNIIADEISDFSEDI